MSGVNLSKTLLIAEDEPDLREPLAMEFETLGFHVLQAKNGVEAYRIVESQKVDAVISDIRMPGGDGVELLKKIKALDQCFPVVMLITGYSDLSHDDAYHLGAEGILSKPFDLDEIGAALNRILTPRSALWAQNPSAFACKQNIQRSYATLADAVEAGELGLGRGGLYLKQLDRHAGVGERVGFQIHFASGEILVLDGTGVVRWTRSADSQWPGGIGLEFESLNEISRGAVVAATDAVRMAPYIPSGKVVPPA